MRKFALVTPLIFFYVSMIGQMEPIVVSEQTIKVGNNEEFYFGFAEGDEIVFDLQVVKGRNLKEVEIIEYPSTSKFFEFKTDKISEKRIKVNKDAIYKFRLKGGGLGTKICRAKILRIPGSEESASFDTSVKWKVRYDSTYTTKYEKILVQTDTSIVTVADRVERVHSKTNLDNPNVTQFNVNLPENKRLELETSEVIAWAYWLGVGSEGQEAYEQEKKNFLMKNTSSLSAIDPVAGLALGVYTILAKPPKGENIQYWFTTYYNGAPSNLTHGNSVIANGRITKMTQGGFTVTLQNDNIMNGVNVSVKIAAIMINKKYEKRPYQKLTVQEYQYPVLSTVK